MRMVRRLGTVMAITMLALGVAASCALPAYHAGESTSSSGGGGKGGASSGGQGGAVTVASSSKAASSSSGSDADAGDASTCNPDLWDHCPLDKQCSCKGQRCYKGDCTNTATLTGHMCDGALWQPVPGGEIVCCPIPFEPCAPGAICVVTDINGTQTPSCVNNTCVAQNMVDLCMCKSKLCTDQAAPNCSVFKPKVVLCN